MIIVRYTIHKFRRERKDLFITSLAQWAFVMRGGADAEQDGTAAVLNHSSAARDLGAAVERVRALFEQTPDWVPHEMAQLSLDKYGDVEELAKAAQAAAAAEATKATSAPAAASAAAE